MRQDDGKWQPSQTELVSNRPKTGFCEYFSLCKAPSDLVTVQGQVQKCFRLDSLRKPTSTPVSPVASGLESPVM